MFTLFVDTNESSMPPTVSFENVVGMATYTTKAVLGGRFRDAVSRVKSAVKSVI